MELSHHFFELPDRFWSAISSFGGHIVSHSKGKHNEALKIEIVIKQHPSQLVPLFEDCIHE